MTRQLAKAGIGGSTFYVVLDTERLYTGEPAYTIRRKWYDILQRKYVQETFQKHHDYARCLEVLAHVQDFYANYITLPNREQVW